MNVEPASDSFEIVDLPTSIATRESLAPYGQLIEASEDGTPFGPEDAVLDLSQGTPRLYIMRLHNRGMVVKQITRHRRVTQCLAAVGDEPWLIALAPPLASREPDDEPEVAAIRGFRILPGMAIKLHAGTWHAGPYFAAATMNFFNLELADTNETDHQNAYFAKRHGIALRFNP